MTKITKIKFDDNLITTINSQPHLSTNRPVVYVLRNDKIAYIGETASLKYRMNSHLKDSKRNQLTDAIVIEHDKFNKSATLNIETNLINYFLGDGKYQLQNTQKTKQKITHDYYQKNMYNVQVFEEIWSDLIRKNIVDHSLEDIQNKDVFKLSPFRELSEEQYSLKNLILDLCSSKLHSNKKHTIVIQGDAGTGKSLLISSLFNQISLNKVNKINKYENIDINLLVNNTELYKSYSNLCKNISYLKKNNVSKPTPFINRYNKNNAISDITIVDEAHLLLSTKDSFNSYKGENHIKDIIDRSKITILFVDFNQYLKIKSSWSEKQFDSILKQSNSTLHLSELTTQFRMNANKEIMNWINAFVQKKILPIPESTNKFEFKVFDDCNKMYNEIKIKNSKYGLSRIVSTFDFEHKKDGKVYYVKCGDFKLPWNITTSSKAWAENEKTINEIGSVYTIQGFDLNYAAVIIGPSFKYDKINDKICIDINSFKDSEAKKGYGQLKSGTELVEKVILNSLNVLLKRPINGLYLYIYDEELRSRIFD